MATVNIVFSDAVQHGGSALVGSSGASELITTSGTSQQTTITADGGSQIARVHVSGGAVWIAAGANPTAAEGTTYRIGDGGVEYIGQFSDGHKIAVIDA